MLTDGGVCFHVAVELNQMHLAANRTHQPLRRMAVTTNTIVPTRQSQPEGPTMSTELEQRPQWEIDKALEDLIGQDVRVAATSFSPVRRNENEPSQLTPVHRLSLPEYDQPAAAPVYFEGRLQRFTRQPGAVLVWLGPRTSTDGAPDGPICFRGSRAVIVQGPAVVELASPFRVEALQADSYNYWRDINAPSAQFEFTFPSRERKGNNGEGDLPAKPTRNQVSNR